MPLALASGEREAAGMEARGIESMDSSCTSTSEARPWMENSLT